MAASKQAGSGTGEHIPAPLRLADHTSKRAGLDMEPILQRAQYAVETLSGEFLGHAKSDLIKLKSAHQQLESAEADSTELQKIFGISHELRGLAGSFDIPLLTKVGTSLCDFVDKLEGGNALCHQVIDLHISAMIQIVAQRISGDGDVTGEELVAGLLAAREKAEATLGSSPQREV